MPLCQTLFLILLFSMLGKDLRLKGMTYSIGKAKESQTAGRPQNIKMVVIVV